ncbi:MAG: hypothetical protein ABW185_17430 [Sedimenticola sp.]
MAPNYGLDLEDSGVVNQVRAAGNSVTDSLDRVSRKSREHDRRSKHSRTKRSRRYSSSSSSSASSSPEVRRRKHRRRHQSPPVSETRELVSSLKSLIEGLVQSRTNIPSGQTTQTDGVEPVVVSAGMQAHGDSDGRESTHVSAHVSDLTGSLGSDTEMGEYGEDTPTLNYADAITAVYALVNDENHCPSQPHPKARVRSLLELEEPQFDSGLPMLPHSSTVKAMADNLETDSGLELNKTGTYVPKDFLRRLAPRSYRVHTEHWPVKNPKLDSDAQKVGIHGSCPPTVTQVLAESLESRARGMVTMSSHLDLFLAALNKGLNLEEHYDTLQVLLQSAAKASRHIMGSAMSMSTDLLLCRRDAAIASASILPGQGRETLRACALTSPKLLGGKCAEVAAGDLADRQRNVLSNPLPRFRKPTPPIRNMQSNQSVFSKPSTSTGGFTPPVASRYTPPTPAPSQRGHFQRGRGRGGGRGTRFSRSRPRRGSF